MRLRLSSPPIVDRHRLAVTPAHIGTARRAAMSTAISSMPHTIADVETYPEQLKTLADSPGPRYVVFSASISPETGLPWVMTGRMSVRTGLSRHYPKILSGTTEQQAGGHTPRRWCPDCVRAIPCIQSVVEARGGSWLEVRVGDKPTWKDTAHPFRSDPSVVTIPTLFHVRADGSLGARCGRDLDTAPSAELAMQVVEKFVEATASE
ncbi:hypothetical protein FOA52_013907 [Chlamydomonas sp. UWO 241]|nr:hypothetical protein FOA52_013907 [Chlamydomonas sp. UWO 241]